MKQFKKVLAFVLALAMVVTAVPTADAKAAAKAPKLNNTKKILYVGQSYTLKIGNLPANWKKCTYAWSTSNKNVTVKKGKYGQAAKVTAVKKGTATVTVKMTYPQTAAQKKAKKKTVKTFKCAVTVKNPSVKFVTTQAEVEVGTTAQFKATAVPSNATITYASSDKAVATVDANGVVTGVADGEAVISASIKTGAKTTTAKTTVKVFTAASTIKQIGAKKVEITLGKAATAETAVSVKKGAVTVSLASKDGKVLSSDGKTLVLTTNANISADKYTVVVGEETLEFTGEASKVAAIEIPSDKAVLSATSTISTSTGLIDAGATATATYVVKNQFGEDVTSTTTVTTSDTTNIDATKGKITFKGTAVEGKRVNDLVAAVLIEQNSGVTASKTFTISNKAAISEVEIKGVYNKDGKTLAEDTNLATDKFYLLVAAKDQYGNAITSNTDAKALIVSVGGLTKTTVATTGTKQTKDGVDYLGLQITATATGTVTAGTENVIIIPAASGKTATGSYTVADGAKVDTFDVTIPDLVVGGETATFAFTATDTYGKEVTNVDTLNAMNTIQPKSNGTSEGFYFEKGKDGKAVLKYKATTKSQDTLATALFVTNTHKVVNKTFTVKKDATPTSITGVKDAALGVFQLAGNKVTIKPENIIVEDQYGREMKKADVAKSAYVKVKTLAATSDDEIFTISAASTTNGHTANLEFTLPANPKAGTENFELKLYAKADNAEIKNSEATITLTSTPQKDTKSYEVDAIDTIYTGVKSGSGTPTEYVKEVKVYGVLSDGTKVAVPANEFSVLSGSYVKSNANSGAKWTVAVDDDLQGTSEALENKDELTDTITVVVNNGAQEIKKEVKVSKVAPKVVEAKLDNGSEISLTSSTTKIELAELTGANVKFGDNGTSAVVIKVKDQYGVEKTITTNTTDDKKTTFVEHNARLSLTDLTDGLKVSDNGTNKAKATVTASGSQSATAKVTFEDGYAITFKVNITGAAPVISNVAFKSGTSSFAKTGTEFTLDDIIAAGTVEVTTQYGTRALTKADVTSITFGSASNVTEAGTGLEKKITLDDGQANGTATVTITVTGNTSSSALNITLTGP